jgi:hypothetical protein
MQAGLAIAQIIASASNMYRFNDSLTKRSEIVSPLLG